jgi:hypothetical protein
MQPIPETGKGAAKTQETSAIEPVHGGIVPDAHQRHMYSPHVVGRDRPGQAGPDPGNFFQDNHGPIITNVHVVPMFWGSAWNDDRKPNPTLLQVYGALASITAGPYMDGLSQYRGVGRGQVILGWGTRSNTSEPPNPFTDDDIAKLVTTAIDAGTVPAPDDLPGSQYLYTVFLPPGVNPKGGGGGEHTYRSHNGQNVHFAWVTHGGSIDSISDTFSHELAEAVTDPEGSAFTFTSEGDPGYPGWIEIGDVCQSYNARLNGVMVQAYWSQRDRACIIPTLNLPPIARWYRLGNQEITHGILNGGLALGVDGHGQMHLFARGDNADLLELRIGATTAHLAEPFFWIHSPWQRMGTAGWRSSRSARIAPSFTFGKPRRAGDGASGRRWAARRSACRASSATLTGSSRSSSSAPMPPSITSGRRTRWTGARHGSRSAERC